MLWDGVLVVENARGKREMSSVDDLTEFLVVIAETIPPRVTENDFRPPPAPPGPPAPPFLHQPPCTYHSTKTRFETRRPQSMPTISSEDAIRRPGKLRGE